MIFEGAPIGFNIKTGRPLFELNDKTSFLDLHNEYRLNWSQKWFRIE
jgi:hypothetical protein